MFGISNFIHSVSVLLSKVLTLFSDNLGCWITIILGGYSVSHLKLRIIKALDIVLTVLQIPTWCLKFWDYFQPTMSCEHLFAVSSRELFLFLAMATKIDKTFWSFLPIIAQNFLDLVQIYYDFSFIWKAYNLKNYEKWALRLS